MESSAYEALITAVNVAIFIVATTIAIILFTTILDLSEYASDSLVPKNSGNIVVESRDLQKRTVTGSELISYYTNNKQSSNKLKVWISDHIIEDLDSYINNQPLKNSFVNKKFEMMLHSYSDSSKEEIYLFKPIT